MSWLDDQALSWERGYVSFWFFLHLKAPVFPVLLIPGCPQTTTPSSSTIDFALFLSFWIYLAIRGAESLDPGVVRKPSSGAIWRYPGLRCSVPSFALGVVFDVFYPHLPTTSLSPYMGLVLASFVSHFRPLSPPFHPPALPPVVTPGSGILCCSASDRCFSMCLVHGALKLSTPYSFW